MVEFFAFPEFQACTSAPKWLRQAMDFERGGPSMATSVPATSGSFLDPEGNW